MQNALDAIDVRLKEGEVDYTPRIYINVDIQNNIVRVVDNGCGMNLEQFKFCFRPNVSFKNRRESRGHKGVGATFVAYGFASVKMTTKQGGLYISGQLSNGRRWAEDNSGSYSRPKFAVHESKPAELTCHGTFIQR